MSIQFSNTTTKAGIIQKIEQYCGFNDGDISGNSTRLAQFTGDVNLAVDQVFHIAFQAGGTWQFDDSNHTDYPIITTNIVSGQRDYSFTSDSNGNLILDVYKVFVADSTGLFSEVLPVDVQSGAPSNYTDGLNTGGNPNTYDKTANSIFLDPIPNYNYTAGLKVYINREGSYFATTDTTKKAGFAGLYHEYLALRPSYFYCLRNKIFDLAERYKREMMEMEEAIADYYKARERDVQKTLIGARTCSR
jgi:hypothetical protein